MLRLCDKHDVACRELVGVGDSPAPCPRPAVVRTDRQNRRSIGPLPEEDPLMSIRIRLAAFAVGVMLIGSACTPQEMALYLESTAPTRDVLSPDELLRLRMCESTDNYRAISPSGTYRGAYQFDQPT